MNLSIMAPSQRFFSGEVSSVMLPGALGTFQVLTGHGPTVSNLIVGNITYVKGNQASSLKVKSGFVLVAQNQVTVVCEPL